MVIYIINIETATKNCSVSLAKSGETISIKEVASEQFSHAEKLHVFIDEIIKENNINWTDIHAVAVSKGPGSYTGLRIGISAAKGLCYALNIPLISVDTLEILANKLSSISEGYIVPMIDARRMEVYTATFTQDFNKINETKALVVDYNLFKDESHTVHLLGDGIKKLESILVGNHIIFHHEYVFPSANEMSKISFKKYSNREYEDVAYFEPFYLKDFILNSSQNK